MGNRPAEACEEAVKRQPDEPRFSYQLGRALIAAGRPADALPYFDAAAQKNYAPAFAGSAGAKLLTNPLLNALPIGPARGVSPTAYSQQVRQLLSLAAQQHDRAVQGGFLESREMANSLRFSKDEYSHPVLGQIMLGEVSNFNAEIQKPETRIYLYSFATNLMGICGPIFDARTITKLAEMRVKVPSSPDNLASSEIQTLNGEIDAQRFIARHGCENYMTNTLLIPAFSSAIIPQS